MIADSSSFANALMAFSVTSIAQTPNQMGREAQDTSPDHLSTPRVQNHDEKHHDADQLLSALSCKAPFDDSDDRLNQPDLSTCIHANHAADSRQCLIEVRCIRANPKPE